MCSARSSAAPCSAHMSWSPVSETRYIGMTVKPAAVDTVARVYCERAEPMRTPCSRCSSECYSLAQRRQSQRPPACKQTNTTQCRPHGPSERPVPWFGPPSARTVLYCWCCGLCDRRVTLRATAKRWNSYTMEQHSHRMGANWQSSCAKQTKLRRRPKNVHSFIVAGCTGWPPRQAGRWCAAHNSFQSESLICVRYNECCRAVMLLRYRRWS